MEKLNLSIRESLPIVNYMARLLSNLMKAVRKKNKKRLREKAKNIVEKDRVLYNKLAKAS